MQLVWPEGKGKGEMQVREASTHCAHPFLTIDVIIVVISEAILSVPCNTEVASQLVCTQSHCLQALAVIFSKA